MFRLFRRKKKEAPEKKIEEKEDKRVSSEIKPSENISDETVESMEPIYEVKETPFEEKFGEYAKILPESLLDEEDSLKDQQTMIPIVERVVDQNDSIFSFISPQIISRPSSTISSVSDTIHLLQKDLPPASLEERIEGALFAVGRPIHISEIIDNFDEDSPTIKRATRRLSRKKKRNSALIIQEISKDRWVLQLNPIFHEFFQSLVPDLFLSASERRVLTEIAYRQPISIALVKKMVTGIGPIKITEICHKLEDNGFLLSEKRSRSLIYTSTPKFARAFGFDNESRRLKLQMLWRLKRLMGDFEEEEPEVIEDSSTEEIADDQVLRDEDAGSVTTPSLSTGETEEDKSETEEQDQLEDLSVEDKTDEKETEVIEEGLSSTTHDGETRAVFEEKDQALEEETDSIITTPVPADRLEEDKAEEQDQLEDLSVEDKTDDKETEIIEEGLSSTTLVEESRVDFEEKDQALQEEDTDSIITAPVATDKIEEDKSDFSGDKPTLEPVKMTATESQPIEVNDYDKINEGSVSILENLESISHSDDSDKDKAIKEIKFGNHIKIIEEE